jgi:hypothetical protein
MSRFSGGFATLTSDAVPRDRPNRSHSGRQKPPEKPAAQAFSIPCRSRTAAVHFVLCKAPGALLYAARCERLFRLFLGSSAVEHSTVNRMVAGSNPARGANEFKHLADPYVLLTIAKFVWGHIGGPMRIAPVAPITNDITSSGCRPPKCFRSTMQAQHPRNVLKHLGPRKNFGYFLNKAALCRSKLGGRNRRKLGREGMLRDSLSCRRPVCHVRLCCP